MIKQLVKTMIIGDRTVYDDSKSLLQGLQDEIFSGNWQSITLCSAFLSLSATESLIKMIDAIDESINITVMVGIKNSFTKPDAVKLLLNYIEERTDDINIRFVLPRDTDFHMKCYVFLNESEGKAFVGSANLTENGLSSRGELMVEIVEPYQINEIVAYIDAYLNESEPWEEWVERYEVIYNLSKPVVSDIKAEALFGKQRKQNRKAKMTIRYAAPTMDELGAVSREQTELVNNIFKDLRNSNPNIIKANWIIYYDMNKRELEEIRRDYPVGSCFDRPRDNNKTWEIGTNRLICYVGAIVNTPENEMIMFMQRGCVHYKVSNEIIEVAESLGIKSDEDGHLPTESEMNEYRAQILKLRRNNKRSTSKE